VRQVGYLPELYEDVRLEKKDVNQCLYCRLNVQFYLFIVNVILSLLFTCAQVVKT
jgi:hypothetical protein